MVVHTWNNSWYRTSFSLNEDLKLQFSICTEGLGREDDELLSFKTYLRLKTCIASLMILNSHPRQLMSTVNIKPACELPDLLITCHFSRLHERPGLL